MTDHIKKLADARAKIKAQAEEIERLKDSSWLYASMEEKNHNLKLLYDKSNRQEAELATLRAQVETLREALKAALGHCDCSDYRGMALIPCTKANPCAGCYTTRTGQAALAATEPKG